MTWDLLKPDICYTPNLLSPSPFLSLSLSLSFVGEMRCFSNLWEFLHLCEVVVAFDDFSFT